MIDKPAASSKSAPDAIQGAAGFAAAGLLSAFLLACAPAPRPGPADPTLPEIDVLRLKDDADEALKLAHENKLEIQTLQAKLQELEERLALIAEQLSAFSAADVDAIRERLSGVEDRLKELGIRAGAADSAAGARTAPSKPVAVFSLKPGPDSAQAPAPGSVQAAKAKKTPPKPHTSELEARLYKQAFDHYYAKRHSQAIETFSQVASGFPGGHYADDAHYWTGECHFAMGNFAKAVASFRKVFSYAETEKGDDAQLKLGYCYLRLGDRRRAVEEFKKVVSLHPDSEYVERAKEEMEQLQ